jgi:hypothetical protein
MKRFFMMVVLALIAGGGVIFAEITFSGNGSATVVPFGARFGDPVETVTSNEVRWGNDGPRIQLVANGKNEAGTVGATIAVNLDSGSFGLDSNAKVWLKPHEIVKFTLGKFEEDDLRYKIGVSGGGFHNYLLYIRGDNLDENAFLSRFKSNGYGAHVAITPGNFYLGAGWGSTFAKRSVAELREDGTLDALANAQVGAGYKIPDVGFVRLMFNGAKATEEDGTDTPGFQPVSADATGRSPSFQAAFQLTAVKGLNIDVGGQVPLAYDYDVYAEVPTGVVDHYVVGTKADNSGGEIQAVYKTERKRISEATEQRPYIVGLGFDLTIQDTPLRFYGRASYKFGGYTETTVLATKKTTTVNDGNDFLFSFTPMYTVATGWIIGLEYVLDIQTGSDLSPILATGARGGDVDAQYIAYWADSSRADEKKKLKNNYVDNGFGLYLRHNFTGGDVRVGATVKLPGGEAHAGAKPQLFIPIILNYNF